MLARRQLLRRPPPPPTTPTPTLLVASVWLIACLKLTDIGSGDGLSPIRRQTITWTIVDLLLKFIGIGIRIQIFI